MPSEFQPENNPLSTSVPLNSNEVFNSQLDPVIIPDTTKPEQSLLSDLSFWRGIQNLGKEIQQDLAKFPNYNPIDIIKQRQLDLLVPMGDKQIQLTEVLESLNEIERNAVYDGIVAATSTGKSNFLATQIDSNGASPSPLVPTPVVIINLVANANAIINANANATINANANANANINANTNVRGFGSTLEASDNSLVSTFSVDLKENYASEMIEKELNDLQLSEPRRKALF